MANAVHRIGVFTSGGDAPGMNAVIRSVVRTSIHMGIECVGIRRGYNGLVHGDFVPLDFDSVSGLSRRGGTMLYSARSTDFKTEEGQEKAVATCKLLGLDGVVGIGGDGTFRGLLELSRRGIAVVGVPGKVVKMHGVSTKNQLAHNDLPDPVKDRLRQMQAEIDCLRDLIEDLAAERR